MPTTEPLTQGEAQDIVAQVLAMHSRRAEERGDEKEADRLICLALEWVLSSIFAEEDR